jgi:signal transduction histidine kinase
MNRDRSNLALSIASEGHRFTAFIYGYSRFSRIGLPLDWLEARVQLDGVVWTDVNDWNQPVEFHLGLPHTNQLHFLGPGNTNLFGLPTLRVGDAARLRRPSDERLKISGTVLAHFSDDRIFLETELGPVQTRLSAPISRGMPSTEVVPREPAPLLEPGERIDLVGAPAESLFAPLLLDAEFRRNGRESPPAPASASPGAMTSGEHDAGLVRFTARLLARERRKSGSVFENALVLEAGDTVFEALWRTGMTNTLPLMPINARLELDGICLVQPGPANLRRTFKILLRGPADVRYLGQAPFWMRPGVARALGVGAVISLGAALWIWLLRRQVRERTAALATANVRMSGEIEERKRAQAELDRALAAERELGDLKSRFVSLVSHEFRTPLGITMSAVELLRNYLDRLPAAKLKELLDDIYSSTLRMSGLMEQVLLLGRVEAGKLGLTFAPLDVAAFGNKLVDETLSAMNRKCPVRFHAADGLAGASGDEALLRHIFSNLLSNAMKYSPNGDPVEFRIERAGTDAVFTVRDRGIGIPEADQSRLFEAFHRAANVSQIPGTGLGLLIVKRCVELHGGTVVFESRPGTGTTFTVRLPLFFNS